MFRDQALEKNQPLSRISILQAMTILVSYLNAVPLHVTINHLSKAGISDSSQQIASIDEDDPFKELIKELDELREAQPNEVPKKVLAKYFSAVDDHAIVTASAATNTKILSLVLDDNNDSDVK